MHPSTEVAEYLRARDDSEKRSDVFIVRRPARWQRE
jgi:hypothetical protein